MLDCTCIIFDFSAINFILCTAPQMDETNYFTNPVKKTELLKLLFYSVNTAGDI